MKQSSIYSLSWLIPTYNNADTIAALIAKTNTIAQKLNVPYEIIVLNDGSTDSTKKIITQLQQALPHLVLLEHAHNAGYGRTIKELYYAGTKEWLCTIPGDFQIDPEEILKLLAEKHTADMLIGHREIRHDSFLRRQQSSLYNYLLHRVYKVNITDINSVRLVKRSVMQKLILQTNSAFVDAELVISAARAGFTIKEIPIKHQARIGHGATGGKIFRTILPTCIDMVLYALKRPKALL